MLKSFYFLQQDNPLLHLLIHKLGPEMFADLFFDVLSGICVAVFTAFCVHLLTIVRTQRRRILVWQSLEKILSKIPSLLQHLYYLEKLAQISNKLCAYEEELFAQIRSGASEKIKGSPDTNKQSLMKQVNVFYRDEILVPYLEQNNFPLYNTIQYQLTALSYHQKKLGELLLLSEYVPKQLSLLLQELHFTVRDFHDEFEEQLKRLTLCFENSKLLANLWEHERKFLTDFHKIKLPTTGMATAQKAIQLLEKISQSIPPEYIKSPLPKLEEAKQDQELEYLKMWEKALDKIPLETLAKVKVKDILYFLDRQAGRN